MITGGHINENNKHRKSTESGRTVFTGDHQQRSRIHFGADSDKPGNERCRSCRYSGTDRAGDDNLGAVLEAAGSSFDKAVKTTCFLANMNDFASFNEIYGRYFTSLPARSCVAVKTLPKNVLVEVEVIAETGNK